MLDVLYGIAVYMAVVYCERQAELCVTAVRFETNSRLCIHQVALLLSPKECPVAYAVEAKLNCAS
jgi:hypothetical protein